MNILLKESRGIILAGIVGLVSLILANYTPSAINSVIIALTFGIAIGNTIQLPANIASGVSFTSSKLLELSILFLAFSINYTHIAELGAVSFIGIAVVLFSVLILTVFLAKRFKCPGSTGWLVGFGTAICGSSAIAALAPSVSKDKEDVAISMAVVNLYGTIGMILLPMILMRLPIDTNQIGFMVGGSLHSVGNVAGAGFTIGNEAGEAAITIKLARVALLSPGLIFINYLINRKSAKSWKDHFKLPWYLIGFILITLIGTFVHFPEQFTNGMETGGKIILTIAMAAIGMKVSFKKLLQSGKKGLGLGLILFIIQLGLLAAFIRFV
ncbi:MAG: putative sulfate exporter family transporter [Fluviicola sp.]|nr:putative sulfate exporter family transporter [Fluviicola sp.]